MGQGYIGWDVSLFMLTIGAMVVNIFYVHSWFKISAMLGVIRLLRATGWLILATRFGFVLMTSGDILISVPSIIALMFLAIGEMSIILFRGKAIQV